MPGTRAARLAHALVPGTALLLALGTALFLLPAPAGAQGASAGPCRVVALGGSVTETVAALGLGHLLVGRDDSSVWPSSVSELPTVGYFRTLGAEGVLSLDPDLVLALEGSGPPAVLEQIRAAGIPVVTVPAEDSPEGAVEKIRVVARALGDPSAGRSLAARVEGSFREAAALRSRQAGAGPRALFLWGRGGGTLMVAGGDTGAGVMMELAGVENAAGSLPGYTPMNAEAVLLARPDLLIVDRATLERMGGARSLLATPGIRATAAAREDRVVTVEVLPFLGFGPRSGAYLLEFMEQLPEATAVSR